MIGLAVLAMGGIGYGKYESYKLDAYKVAQAKAVHDKEVQSQEDTDKIRKAKDAQIANIKAGGGSLDTVAGQQLQKMANGDVTYPPKILIDIAQRAKADLTNVDMQATAAQKFYQKYGDNNMKAFQQEWSKNADTKIFQIMNVANDPKMNRAEQQEETNKLLGITSSMSKDQQKAIRTQFNTKYQNIQKLYNDGTLR